MMLRSTRTILSLLTGIALVAFGGGCQKSEPSSSHTETAGASSGQPNPPAATEPPERPVTAAGLFPGITNAQPRLRTIKLWLGAQELKTEMALTQQQIATGMMFRKEMPENEAMIFVFARPFQVAFYMKNTILPLSCAYIDSEGIIQEIYDMTPLDETPIRAKGENIRYVLEVNQGWFKRNGIGIGTEVRTELGALREIFIH